VHDDVLELQVSMNNPLPVEVLCGVADLQDDLLGFSLGKAFALLNGVVELTVTAQFQQEVDVLLVGEVTVHTGDVEVMQEALNLELTDDLVLQLLVLQHHLRDYF